MAYVSLVSPSVEDILPLVRELVEKCSMVDPMYINMELMAKHVEDVLLGYLSRIADHQLGTMDQEDLITGAMEFIIDSLEDNDKQLADVTDDDIDWSIRWKMDRLAEDFESDWDYLVMNKWFKGLTDDIYSITCGLNGNVCSDYRMYQYSEFDIEASRLIGAKLANIYAKCLKITPAYYATMKERCGLK